MRRLLWIALSIFLSIFALAAIAASSSTRSVGSESTSDTVGDTDWGSTGNAGAEDAIANNILAATESTVQSYYLLCTNFGFTLPAAATIDGIQAEIRARHDTALSASDLSWKIIKNGSVTGDEMASGTWTNTFQYRSKGDPASLWGVSWVAADINSSGFGVAYAINLTASSLGDAIFELDHVRLTVFYTAPGMPRRAIESGGLYARSSGMQGLRGLRLGVSR